MGVASCMPNPLTYTTFCPPNLPAKSTYLSSKHQLDEQTMRRIQQLFPNCYQDPAIINLFANIEELPKDKRQFIDINFPMEGHNTRLFKLYDFGKLKMSIFNPRERGLEMSGFQQQSMEFGYLSAVYYSFIKDKILLNSIIEIQIINRQGIYCVNFFSNGAALRVIIDDRLPTISDSLIYSHIISGNQLWPLIVQKAWCKIIRNGSYEHAKGLSPQDTFEQITGIPTYSYPYNQRNRLGIKNMLADAVQMNHWVCLVGRNSLHDLRNRHIFYLEGMQDVLYNIRAPVMNYHFEGQEQSDRNRISITEPELYSHFQYVVIGYKMSDYAPLSYKINSRPDQQMLFELTVQNQQPISIRFNQFYSGYLNKIDQQNYTYSPVMIQLYDQINQNISNVHKPNYTLRKEYQGCPRAIGGTRSTRTHICQIDFSQNVLERLHGRYYLRLQVAWQHPEHLTQGNLVIYSTPNNVIIKRIEQQQVKLHQIYESIMSAPTFPTENITKVNDYNLQIRIFTKQHSVLMMINNCRVSYQVCQIDFTDSENTRIKYARLIKNKMVRLELGASENIILQLQPEDSKKIMSVAPFHITKLAS